MLVCLVDAEEAVVKVAVLARVYADELASSLVFEDGLDEDLLLLVRELQKLVQVLFLDPVDLTEVLDLIVDLVLDLLDEL
jgi:hypothetical protein